jgi:hypothetical protein
MGNILTKSTNQKIEQKWAFGMAPIFPDVHQSRIEAARIVLDLIEAESGLSTESSEVTLELISLIKGLFNRVLRQDQWDWFTVSRQLGSPPYPVADLLAKDLARLRSALRDGDSDSFRQVCKRLITNHIRPYLYTFVGIARRVVTPGTGWIYLLSTRQSPELLKIGMTNRTVERRVQEINSATGVAIPYGVRACWQVVDAEKAERADREFFNLRFAEAFSAIQLCLEQNKLEVYPLFARVIKGNCDENGKQATFNADHNNS